MSEVTQLDLDKPVTREHYEHAVSHLIEFLTGELSNRMDWCEERFRYFAAIIPEFDRYKTGYLDFAEVPQDADYAARLRDMRGKLLYYTAAGTITLEVTNEILRKSGLPEYHAPGKPTGLRLRINLTGLELNVAVPSKMEASAAANNSEAITWVRDHLQELVVSALDGKPSPEDNRYVPGSAKFVTNYQPEVYIAREEGPTIDSSQIVRPSYT